MKKGIKVRIFYFVLGALLFGSIGVFASQVLSKDISYTKKDGTVTNVDEALTELYNRSSDCVSGTFEHQANTQWNIPIGFETTKIYASFNNFQVSYFYADLSIINQFYISYKDSKNHIVPCGDYVSNGETLTTNFPTDWETYTNAYTVFYVACK